MSNEARAVQLLGGRNRIPELDFIRGFCIVLMVYGHTSRTGSLAQLQNEYVIPFIYLFHVPVFTLISGYLFNPEQGVSGIRKAVDRLLRPYLICGPILLGLMAVASMLCIQTSGSLAPSYTSIIWGFLKGNGGGAMWFIYALFCTQLIFNVSFYIGDKMRSGQTTCWLMAGMLFWGIFQLNTSCSPWFVLCFVSGMLLRRIDHCIPKCWAVVPFAMLLYACELQTSGTIPSLARLLFSICILMALHIAASACDKLKGFRVLYYLGKHTMPILVFHPFFNVLFKPILINSLLIDASGITFSILNTSLVIGICLIAEWLMHQISVYPFVFGSQKSV